MSKGNPIVGLAYVVTSQQEMLEEAGCKIAEYEMRIDEIKSENAELNKQCEEKDATISELRTELRKTREDLQKKRDDCVYLSLEYDHMNKQLIELEEQLKRE